MKWIGMSYPISVSPADAELIKNLDRNRLEIEALMKYFVGVSNDEETRIAKEYLARKMKDSEDACDECGRQYGDK